MNNDFHSSNVGAPGKEKDVHLSGPCSILSMSGDKAASQQVDTLADPPSVVWKRKLHDQGEKNKFSDETPDGLCQSATKPNACRIEATKGKRLLSDPWNRARDKVTDSHSIQQTHPKDRY